MMSCNWMPNDARTSWIHEEQDHITEESMRPLREKNSQKNDQEESGPSSEARTTKNGKYVHVPHREKPPQVVAKRNARERRRVQAVNCAFIRLRKAVPLENTRGKRVSKVKTLQYAIEYIHRLQELLDNYNNKMNYYPIEQRDHKDYLYNYESLAPEDGQANTSQIWKF